ncbi:MAG: hypothetical protein OQL16_04065, partial [Gammaproteobacteria bacterium]|nr:hypothetical protein [Gammaproteobacteria bacterium]
INSPSSGIMIACIILNYTTAKSGYPPKPKTIIDWPQTATLSIKTYSFLWRTLSQNLLFSTVFMM